MANEPEMMTNGSKCFFVADIGGTNGRFGICTDGAIDHIKHFAVADFQSLEALVLHYLERIPRRDDIGHGVIAVAGPVADQSVKMTNLPWEATAGRLAEKTGVGRVVLINDFEAIARCLPSLDADGVVRIGGGQSASEANIAVIGPGSGVGVSAVLRAAEGEMVLATEAGQATIPTVTSREDEIVSVFREQAGHVSIEDVLCGSGLVRLYEAVCILEGKSPETMPPAAVSARAVSGTCPRCAAAMSMYFSLLGTVAGNLALTFDARGGIYLAGGILPRLTGQLSASEFRSRFEAKGQFRDYLSNIATSVIVHPYPGLLGAANYVNRGVRILDRGI